ncbi:MAG: electron transfer flavoprotein subunit alpha/FixB family protein [Chloroflexi bacterium]|nr:electron transfer flavoprotein subunit alpha/FixB family protein [Chloroflexota bacterium]
MTAAKRSVWVWAGHFKDEPTMVSLGLLGKAHEISQQLGDGEVVAVLAGTDSRNLVAELIDHGADKVYLANNPRPSSFEPELCSDFMTRLIQEHQPEIVLWGATSLEREIAARVAAKLGTGLTAHCMDLYIGEVKGEQQLVAVVAGWGGNLALKIICPWKRPQMATVKPGIFLPPKPQKRSGEVIEVKVADRPSRLELVEVVERQEEAGSLEQAETVVVGGWGLSSIDGLTAARELTQALGGATGGTRPALDAGWITAERMVGQSGITIAPRLLVTLGVSGAAQFATGVLRSGFILAIDKNPNAPIFEMADLGIVGDLKEVLPLLISKIRAIEEKN